MTRPPSRSRRAKGAAVALSFAAVLAACGGDGGDSAAEPTTGTSGTPAEETSATTAGGSDGGSASTSGFASMDEIAALCPPDEAPDRLVFSTWDSHEALIGPAFEPFTEATGVEVEFLNNSLGDRLTKMAAEKGSPTIDAALVPINEVPALLANGITEETDTSIPNYDQLLDVAKFDGGYGTSILQFGIAYNPEFVTTPPTSWGDLLDPAYAGHIAFPAMPNSGGYATLSMLTRLAGGDDGDLTPGIEMVAEAKDSIATFYPSTPSIEPQVLSGEIWIYPDIGGAVLAAQERGVPVEVVIPEEGGPAGLNTVVVPAGSDHPGCVKAFVSHFLGQEVQEAWGTALHYGSPSTSFVAPEGVEVYPQDNETLVAVDWPTIAQNGPDTLDTWNRSVVG